MSDAELQAKYPLPPEMSELADTVQNGGQPMPRPAATGVEQMQAILTKLKADKSATLTALNFATGEKFQKLFKDLEELNREIDGYEARLQAYQVQQQGLN